MTYIVYKAISPSNKVYIGITSKTLKIRRKEHEYAAKGQRSKRIFYFALIKHNFNFEWSILEKDLTKFEAENKEIFYIKYYKSINRNFGYNQAKGGLAGDIRTEESKIKHKNSMKKYYQDINYINKITKYQKDQSKFNFKEYSKKMQNQINNYFSDVNNRIKHSIIKGGKPFKCNETNEIFYSLKLAAEKLNINYQNIYKILKKQRKQTKGYTFNYI